MVLELLKWKASVRATGSTGESALSMACYKGHLETARVLLQQPGGAGVNTANDDGITPLMMACMGGHLEVARLLLDHHASKSAVTIDGSTAFMFITEEHEDFEELRDLMEPEESEDDVEESEGQNESEQEEPGSQSEDGLGSDE